MWSGGVRASLLTELGFEFNVKDLNGSQLYATAGVSRLVGSDVPVFMSAQFGLKPSRSIGTILTENTIEQKVGIKPK